MKLVGSENAGYRIISSAEFANPEDGIIGVVFAERINPVGIDDYVTWEYNFYGVDPNVPNFYWGHYYKYSDDAYDDFLVRGQRLFGIDGRTEADEIRQSLFETCDYFSKMADYQTEIDNRAQADEFTHKELGVMAVLEELDLVEAYREWRQ